MTVDAGRIALQVEVEQFLYYEAWLLDERRLYEWLDCFTEDVVYSLAVRETTQVSAERLAPLEPPKTPLLVDDKQFMTTRVQRLETRLAHAEQPPSFTRHLVTNVLIHEPAGAELQVSSNFMLLQSRIDITAHTFCGKRDDTLRKERGKWLISRRAVILDRAPLPSTLSVFF